ncbi:major facilitator superfamily domain-containing protein [Cantharellus anzutake]|uniref:major facilitator superfamily domain-containing protein n=1 Tax=Cantharellus anzutake TaxID=1750568 RepID=UPI001907A2B4|nr:major facilitator superfamily domain-containing protein [Cantharellus anzutake]KAF8342277.1 major facilitator superfamily domain-containing protein [Cantharellus anzutake]
MEVSLRQAVINHLRSYKLPDPPRRDGPSKFELLKQLELKHWLMFFSGWLAWTCDALDFFSVSLTVTFLSKQFDRSTHDITTSITLTLLFRSLGAVLFGLASDRFGRKYPLVFNLFLITVLQVGTSFCQTFKQFLACRSLFGIGMGGVWGMASATALESLPVELRGLGSGVLQQGYAVGYLIAAVVNLTLVAHNRHKWRTLFWFAACLSFVAGLVRLSLPESDLFLRAQNEKRELKAKLEAEGKYDEVEGSKTRIFLRRIGQMLKEHWLLCIYGVLLMTGFNFLSHGSQDLYPTYLQASKGFDSYHATVATIIGNLGAITGGATAGFVSQYLGRRLTIILFILLVGCFIPLWILPYSFGGLSAGAFFVQFGVQGAWGVIPVQLAELSPPGFRATWTGVVYQLGNMVSSASAQIEATGGDHLKTRLRGKIVPDYAKVQGILLGTVAIFTIIVTFLGPERHSTHFEEHALAFEEGGKDNAYAGEAHHAGDIAEETSGMSDLEKKNLGDVRLIERA